MTSATPATVVLGGQEHTPPQAWVTAGQTQVSRQAPFRRVPLTMPRAQEYFWSSGWQQGERAAAADRAAGRRVRFDSDDPTDAADALDAPDEPDAS
jgi:hypothetical protein